MNPGLSKIPLCGGGPGFRDFNEFDIEMTQTRLG